MIRRIYFAFAFMILWMGMVLVGDAVGVGQIHSQLEIFFADRLPQ